MFRIPKQGRIVCRELKCYYENIRTPEILNAVYCFGCCWNFTRDPHHNQALNYIILWMLFMESLLLCMHSSWHILSTLCSMIDGCHGQWWGGRMDISPSYISQVETLQFISIIKHLEINFRQKNREKVLFPFRGNFYITSSPGGDWTFLIWD